MGSKLVKAEGLLRLTSMVLAIMTVLVAALDTQTKTIFFLQKKATVKILQPLWIYVIVASVVASYQLIQTGRCLISACFTKSIPPASSSLFAWVCFLLDQGATYIMFASSVAAAQASLVGVTGVKQFQWEKLCNIYSKFCVQMGGAIALGLATAVAMAVVTTISARRLFRLYPSYGRLSRPPATSGVSSQLN